jgi:xanthine/CO dehydrogenase XdhC/CoxF family maturation factor
LTASRSALATIASVSGGESRRPRDVLVLLQDRGDGVRNVASIAGLGKTASVADVAEEPSRAMT